MAATSLMFAGGGGGGGAQVRSVRVGVPEGTPVGTGGKRDAADPAIFDAGAAFAAVALGICNVFVIGTFGGGGCPEAAAELEGLAWGN